MPGSVWEEDEKFQHWKACSTEPSETLSECITREQNRVLLTQANTATILSNTTCWADPLMVDRTVYQCCQILNATVPKLAKEPNRKILPISEAMPNIPKMAMEIFLSLIARQREEGNYVYESYLTAVRTF